MSWRSNESSSHRATVAPGRACSSARTPISFPGFQATPHVGRTEDPRTRMYPEPLKQKARRAHPESDDLSTAHQTFQACPSLARWPCLPPRHDGGMGNCPGWAPRGKAPPPPMQSAGVMACGLQAMKHGTLRDANLKLGKIHTVICSKYLTHTCEGQDCSMGERD